jgi:hypothetical protein
MATQYATRNQYADMQRMCGTSSSIFVSNKMAVRIMHRLCKKFKMLDTKIVFRGHRDSGCSFGGKVRLSHNPSIYLIMHEFAHEAQGRSTIFRTKLTNIKNVGTTHHGLHYETVLNQVNLFCKASNYFEKMRNRTRKNKAATTPPSPIKTEMEVSEMELDSETEFITQQENESPQ